MLRTQIAYTELPSSIRELDPISIELYQSAVSSTDDGPEFVLQLYRATPKLSDPVVRSTDRELMVTRYLKTVKWAQELIRAGVL